MLKYSKYDSWSYVAAYTLFVHLLTFIINSPQRICICSQSVTNPQLSQTRVLILAKSKSNNFCITHYKILIAYFFTNM